MRSKLIIAVISLLLVISCSKEDKPVQQQDEPENTPDTNLTPEEKFSSAILTDFLSESEDEELANYLETEIYKLGSGYKGVSVIEIYPAVWFVMLEKDTTTKNYRLQKFVDFKTNKYYFNMKETSLTITDLISRKSKNTAAGE